MNIHWDDEIQEWDTPIEKVTAGDLFCFDCKNYIKTKHLLQGVDLTTGSLVQFPEGELVHHCDVNAECHITDPNAL